MSEPVKIERKKEVEVEILIGVLVRNQCGEAVLSVSCLVPDNTTVEPIVLKTYRIKKMIQGNH